MANETMTAAAMRKMLFEEIEALRTGYRKPEIAKQIAALSGVALKSIEIEMSFRKQQQDFGKQSSEFGGMELADLVVKHEALPHSDDKDKIVESIRAMVPQNIVADIREDLVNDLIVAVLGREMTLEDVPGEMKKRLAQARKFQPNEFRDIPLDAPLRGTEDFTIGDTLAAPEPYSEEEDPE